MPLIRLKNTHLILNHGRSRVGLGQIPTAEKRRHSTPDFRVPNCEDEEVHHGVNFGQYGRGVGKQIWERVVDEND